MHLFLYDNLLQLDTITPVIDIIKDQRKIMVSSLNITHGYKNNNLIKYLKRNDIRCLSFPPTSKINITKLFLIKLLLTLPKKILLRFQFFFYKLDNIVFLNENIFLNFLTKEKIKTISIPNDLTHNKKVFLYNLKLYYDLKIIEIEVGLRTLKTDPYSKFPQDYCDFYLASNKFLNLQNKNDKDFNRKTKFFGSSRYSNLWIKKLDELNKITVDADNKILNVAIFMAPRIFEENPNFLKNCLKLKNINLEIGNKPKSVLPLKCTDYHYDKLNSNQLINWADVIISHGSSVLVEAAIKNKKIYFCSFLKFKEKYGIFGDYLENIKGISRIKNFEQLIENIENEDINNELDLFNKDDQFHLNKLRGFDNDLEMINNYMNFYKSVILE